MANTDVRPIEIGSYIYLWRDQRGPRKTKCIITAHGREKTFRSEKPMKGLLQRPNLHFYSRHGHVTPGEGVNVFRNTTPVETIQQAASDDYYLCPDYHLYKYTNGFTVGHGWSKHNEGHEDYNTVKYSAGFEDYDVVTIRSRYTPVSGLKSKVSGILFSDVINELAKAGYTYQDIYCAFCRGGKD